ncbi:alpha/beta hydrolase [Sphingomonas crusticola]|uniref:alpha/beta hydrolase n=1 Tax=Sphingomonas crusticola TaxID=1697973 RepID=UPI000E251874|nr:alpha/beta hydrolase [Sphingomonas crusticola]
MIPRREILALGAGLCLASQIARAAPPAVEPTTIPLWPGLPPGAPAILPVETIVDQGGLPSGPNRYILGIARPTIQCFVPERQTSDGAVLLMPGGSYLREVIDREGLETVRLLNARGITAFLLRYRLPAEGWHDRSSVALQDAQRAVRLIRARATQFGLNPSRIAAVGFSAGGHLAASLAVGHARPTYAAVDSVDRVSARPDLVGLLYPVIGMAAPLVHARSRDALLGSEPTAEAIAAQSVERNVTADTPPVIIFHAADDASVPVENSLAMFAALRAAGGPSELHLFEHGGHGFGIGGAVGKTASAWPDLFLGFAKSHDILDQASNT